MSNLAKVYCKEIAKTIDKIPIYLPGAFVEVGYIIKFNDSFWSNKPIGSFTKISSLDELIVHYEIETQKEEHPYTYTTQNGVTTSFIAESNNDNGSNGKLEIDFSKEGAIYFNAIGCKQTQIKDLAPLKAKLSLLSDYLDWKNLFLVVSIIKAKKALIMQASTNNAKLIIEGNVRNFPSNFLNSELKAKLNIEKCSNEAFIKDWSEDVNVFFSLAKIDFKNRNTLNLETCNFDPDNVVFELINASQIANMEL